MASAYGYKLVEVTGIGGYKYTNPGGFVERDGVQYVIVRRAPSEADMASEDARGSDVVLLRRSDVRTLIDADDVVFKADATRSVGYEDPRLLHDASAFTLTLVSKDSYRSWLVDLVKGHRGRRMYPVGPRGALSKNGYVYQTSNGRTMVVSRMCETKSIQFYLFGSMQNAEKLCMGDESLEVWDGYRVGVLSVPHWLRGEHGGFGHAGFGTILSPTLAIVHFGKANGRGKYYVTALQRLNEWGIPSGPPEIIAEPAKSIPSGDVPNVIYTTMAWTEGSELVLWSGHDDSAIVECRVKLPRWAYREITRHKK